MPSSLLPAIGPTTKAHFEAIGRVAYEWSRLEIFAQNLVAGLAGIPSETAANRAIAAVIAPYRSEAGSRRWDSITCHCSPTRRPSAAACRWRKRCGDSGTSTDCSGLTVNGAASTQSLRVAFSR
jgi:hypothetical protein